MRKCYADISAANKDQHSATKAKDMEGNLPPSDLLNAPPVMPWRQFADWIRMGDEHDVVWGWIRNGYIPSHKVGKYVMVNVVLLTKQLVGHMIRAVYGKPAQGLSLHGRLLAVFIKSHRMVERLKNPIAITLTATDFAEYRAKRINSGISPKTLNNELSYLRAMFNELRRLGEIDYQNPLVLLRAIRVQERELTYLDTSKIDQVFGVMRNMRHPHVELIAMICLVTGCRWGEAQALTVSRVADGALQFVNTKSKRRRVVPIDPKLADRIRAHLREHGAFSNCRDRFDEAVARAGLNLPAGQKSHVPRHTFASHFIANGGNILTLQKILGHSSLAMTMRYAHLSPDHLQDVLAFGPAKEFRHFFDTPLLEHRPS